MTAVALVSSGFGLTITTQSATPDCDFLAWCSGRLFSAHLRDVELSCLYRRSDSSPVLAAFLQVVHEFARDPLSISGLGAI